MNNIIENPKLSKHDLMYLKIQSHGVKLNQIFHTDLKPIELCKKLRRIELPANREAVRYCNGEIDCEQWEAFEEKVLAKLDKLLNFRKLGVPVFVNGDPRGYALKIDDYWVIKNRNDIYQDWGGYGILAPDFSE